jgi:zinc protease
MLHLLLPFILAATATIPPVSYTHRVLPNGLEVYSIPDRSAPTVAVHVWYRVGSKHDPANRSGFAHLFEHIMFKSTKNMPSEFFDRLTEDVGGWNNATTLEDATAYFEVVPSNHLERILWAEGERMGALNVDDGNFQSERDVVKEEFRYRILTPPYGQLFYAIETESFTKHPYKFPGIGSMENLDAATIDDVRSFHSTFYRPDNAVLIVAGDFEPKQLDAWVDKYLGAIAKPPTEVPRVNVSEPARSEEKRVTKKGANVALPALAMTWLVPNAAHEDSAALAMASTLLSDGESSRLQLRMVRGEIAQDVYSDADSREDLGIFVVLAIMASGHDTPEAEKVLREEIGKLASNPVSASELDKAKNLIVTSALRTRETNNGKAFALGEAVTVQGNANAVNTQLARIQAVTPADIQRVAKKYLVDGKAAVITYVDQGEPKE